MREDVAMVNNRDLRVVDIQPPRALRVGDDIYMDDPWGALLHRAQREAQLVVISPARLGPTLRTLICGRRRHVTSALSPPLGVVSINPRIYEVNRKGYTHIGLHNSYV